MVCRLCLAELNDLTSIFSEYECEKESDIPKLIAKYFHIELQIDDAVSNKICSFCLKHLNDFHDFWLIIERKQQSLLDRLQNCTSDVIEDVRKSIFYPDEDIKDVPLYEPHIDPGYLDQLKETNKLDSCETKEVTSIEDDKYEDAFLSNVESSSSLGDDKCKRKNITKKKTRNLQSKFEKKADNYRKYECKECKKMLANYNSLRNHMHRRHVSKEDLKFECHICEKKFAKKYVLDGHLITHSKPDNFIKCKLCQKGFSTKRSYKAHRKMDHSEELHIICDSCGKRFKHKIGYEVHYKYAHTQLKEPEVQCQVCSLWLKNGRSLERHMYNHRDESSGKEFVCNICGIVKFTKKKLTAHKNYHHPQKMHKCTLCNKEFKRLLALEEHMAVHTGQPLYTCKFCPQTFKSNGNMHSHRRRLHRNENMTKTSLPTCS